VQSPSATRYKHAFFFLAYFWSIARTQLRKELMKSILGTLQKLRYFFICKGALAEENLYMKPALEDKKPEAAIVILPFSSELEQRVQTILIKPKWIVGLGFGIKISQEIEGNTLRPVFHSGKLRTAGMVQIAELTILFPLVYIFTVPPDYGVQEDKM
jgi:hypothetical protein